MAKPVHVVKEIPVGWSFKSAPSSKYETAYLDGCFIGFREIGSTQIAVQRCDECHKENHALSVLSGICCWCGWDANTFTEGDGLHREGE